MSTPNLDTQTTSVVPHFASVWDLEDPVKVERELRAIFQVYSERSEIASSVLQAELHTQISRALGLQKKFELADQHIHQAIQICEANEPMLQAEVLKMVKARIALEKGRLLRTAGKVEESVEYFRSALAEAQDITFLDYYAVDALHMLALVEPEEKDRRQMSSSALQRALKSSNVQTRGWAAALLNNEGWAAIEIGDFKGATELFEQAANVREEQYRITKSEHRSQAAQNKALKTWRIAKYSIGFALRMQGSSKFSEALKVQMELLKSGHDGPFLREELALLCGNSGFEFFDANAAAMHAQKAFELGFSENSASKERVLQLQRLIKEKGFC